MKVAEARQQASASVSKRQQASASVSKRQQRPMTTILRSPEFLRQLFKTCSRPVQAVRTPAIEG